MNAQPSPEIRVLGTAIRWVFLLGTIFVVAAGVQLYVLTAHTDDFFAWTIGVSMSAAFLGAFYWMAGGIAWCSYTKPAWSDVRVGIFGVLVFELLTLAMTVMHFDLFHFDSSSFTAKGAAYAWLLIYILDPLLIVVGLYQQQRLPGVDRPRIALLPAWYRARCSSRALDWRRPASPCSCSPGR